MNIIVTGGAGFIGSHIVDEYIKQGHTVLVIDNLSSGKKQNLNPKALLEELDINNPKLQHSIETFKPEIISHQAAQIEVRASVDDPAHDAEINILGSLRILEAARKTSSVKKILFASSGGAAYGDALVIPTDENQPTQPISPYGVAKVSVEHYLFYYYKVYGLPYVALRYANVYGPRQNPHGEAGVVAIFYQRVLSKKEFVINGEGNQTRDFVFVTDVAAANILATQAEYIGPVNVGTGIETRINELVSTMAKSINLESEIPHGPTKAGEQARSCLSYQRASQVLGWKPQVDLTTGITLTSEFFKSQV